MPHLCSIILGGHLSLSHATYHVVRILPGGLTPTVNASLFRIWNKEGDQISDTLVLSLKKVISLICHTQCARGSTMQAKCISAGIRTNCQGSRIHVSLCRSDLKNGITKSSRAHHHVSTPPCLDRTMPGSSPPSLSAQLARWGSRFHTSTF